MPPVLTPTARANSRWVISGLSCSKRRMRKFTSSRSLSRCVVMASGLSLGQLRKKGRQRRRGFGSIFGIKLQDCSELSDIAFQRPAQDQSLADADPRHGSAWLYLVGLWPITKGQSRHGLGTAYPDLRRIHISLKCDLFYTCLAKRR